MSPDLEALLSRVLGASFRPQPVPPNERATVRSAPRLQENAGALNYLLRLIPEVCPRAVTHLVAIPQLDRRALDAWRRHWNLTGGFVQPLLFHWAIRVWHQAHTETGTAPVRLRLQSFNVDSAAQIDRLDARPVDENDPLAPVGWQQGELLSRFVARAKAHARARRASLRTARPLTGLQLHCEWLLCTRWSAGHTAKLPPTLARLRELRSAHPAAFETSRVPMWNELLVCLPDSKASAWTREVRALGIDVPM